MSDFLKYSSDIITTSSLQQEDQELLIQTGFPQINFPFGTFNTYKPLTKEASTIKSKYGLLFTLAEDKETMTQIVIDLDNNNICFYESWENRLYAINSCLQYFIEFYRICDDFFTHNPEFNEDDYTIDESCLKKIKHLEAQLKSIDETPFQDKSNAWSYMLETMYYAE